MIVPSSGVEILDNAVHLLAKDAQQDSYRTNPQGWAEDVLGLHMWSKQVKVCESVRDHKRTTVAAAHSVGKSAIRSEEHTSELQSRGHLVCRLLLEKKKSVRG